MFLRLFIATVLASGPVLAQTRAGGANTLADSLRRSWATARDNITQSAELMPEEHYAFKPVDSVRSFGAILAHLAGANYVFCSAARGEKSPHAEDEFEKSAATRAAIVKALAESIAYCDKAFDAVTDRSLSDPVAMPFGGGQAPRAQAVLGNIAHLNEHYGNLVTYFRMKGIVPPSSRR